MQGATEVLFLLYAGVLGLAVGSFLNVCIGRLPKGESLIRPRSRCPRCGEPIAWYDNVPVVSWLLLRGRCRACGAARHRRALAGRLAARLPGRASPGERRLSDASIGRPAPALRLINW